jgi:hypothetical protein
MPSYSEVRQIIEERFASQWTFTPVIFGSVPEVDMGDVNRPSLPEGVYPYIWAQIFHNASAAAEVGQNAIRRSWGNLAVDFYSKEDTGSDVNAVNIDNLTNIFEYQTIQDIVFRDITILRPTTAEGWYITPTMIRFYFNR